MIPDRKGLVSGSVFCYLSVCRRSVSPCSGRGDVDVEALVLSLVADYLVKLMFALLHVDVLQWCWHRGSPPSQADYGRFEGDLSAVLYRLYRLRSIEVGFSVLFKLLFIIHRVIQKPVAVVYLVWKPQHRA